MQLLKNKLESILPTLRSERNALMKEHGETVLSSVTIEQVFGGMRGVPALICDTSSVSADEGLRIRNFPILELVDSTPEEIFFLLVTGEKPNAEEAEEVKQALAQRSHVPSYVWDILKAMPNDTHPMVMLSTAILALEKNSKFSKAYHEAAGKEALWHAVLEDTLDLLGAVTGIAAGIYRIRFGKGEPIDSDPTLDYSSNFAHMLGISDDPTLKDLLRLYLVLHSDHEGGNVSAMTGYVVSSALSDVYYSTSAGLNGLAGPLHGLANQECLRFVLDVLEKFGGVPSDDDLKAFTWERLNGGQVIPGYGHAVLRVIDPRFTAFYNFAESHDLNDDTVNLMKKLFQIVPGVLTEQGKAKNPWPNVDAASGSLLQYYGMKEFEFYTVMFGVSRAMGICSQILVNRMMGASIVRPKSLTMAEMKKAAGL